ncbi:MAG TPA: folylpolyglutamate synthase/dihydrofolate synthase family protein [Bacteroidia bacterium]|nr:folylpolyglutamate synthase/dihydrofolate synthase family protein [Bacteroidia bacterium]
MNYREAIDFLYSRLPMFHRVGAAAYKADLKNTIELCSLLGNPENKFRSVHIAGTNGKGSTSHMLASVLQRAGYKIGLYTSPHLLDFRERIRINGEMIPQQEVISFIEKHQKDFERIHPSFFEWTVALAFDFFAREKVDVAIIETGLGGRLDSTNVITPLLSVITNIGLDHTNLLGDTLEKIAVEKAGILKKNIPVVIGETQREIKNVFLAGAYSMNAAISFADDVFTVVQNKSDEKYLWVDMFKQKKIYLKNLQLDLPGNYQLKNSATVAAAVDEMKKHFTISEGSLRKGLKNVKGMTGLRGRWEVLQQSPLVICDVAHNAEGIKYIAEQIRNSKHTKLHFVFGTVNDKPIDAILKILPREAEYYFCSADIPRTLDSTLLASQAMAVGLKGENYFTVNEAVNAAIKNSSADDLVFIGGSTFVVAEAIACLTQPSPKERA